MTVLTFPAQLPAEVTFGLVAPGTAFVSPFTGAEQTRSWPGARWRATLAFGPLTDAERRTLAAFLVSLDGIGGRFWLFDHAARQPRGSAAGAPVVDGGDQDGGTLATKGWTPGQAGVLLAGDYVAFDTAGGRRELKMLTADAAADGSGEAVLSIAPPIRRSPADEAALIVTDASCMARLADPEQARWQVARSIRLGRIEFEAIETFDSSQ